MFVLVSMDINLIMTTILVLVCYEKKLFIYIYLLIFFIINKTDIDECSLNITRCTQGCHNNVGSYHCICQTGYYLGNDGHACFG